MASSCSSLQPLEDASWDDDAELWNIIDAAAAHSHKTPHLLLAHTRNPNHPLLTELPPSPPPPPPSKNPIPNPKSLLPALPSPRDALALSRPSKRPQPQPPPQYTVETPPTCHSKHRPRSYPHTPPFAPPNQRVANPAPFSHGGIKMENSPIAAGGDGSSSSSRNAGEPHNYNYNYNHSHSHSPSPWSSNNSSKRLRTPFDEIPSPSSSSLYQMVPRESDPWSAVAKENVDNTSIPKDKDWMSNMPTAPMFRHFQNAALSTLDKGDYMMMQGKFFIKKSGWRKIAFFFNISFEIKDKSISFDQNRNVLRAEFVVRARMQSGRYTDAWGSCDRGEKKFSKPNHDIPSTAETRAKTRSCQDLLGIGEYKMGGDAW